MSFCMSDVADHTGRLAIITGANTGLGYQTALAMVAKNIKVVMACRNVDKAQEAKYSMLAEVPNADIEILKIDLSSLASVRSAVSEFRRKHDKLDILVNNAGIMYPPYSKTKDGFESQMAVNCFGHFLLTSLLMDYFPDSPNSRITWLSSIAHKSGEINFADINFKTKYSAMASYSQSKLTCLMYALELARKLKAEGKQIKSICAHPGVSNTDLSRNMPQWIHNIVKYTVMPLIAHSPRKAALPTLEAALSPTAQSGQYYGPQGPFQMSGPSGIALIATQAQDTEVAKKLWKLSEQLTGAIYPE
ncbi:MAG: oxidoreductase [Colwellia sp.]|nr:oxidoreductase [Colwellia sp.]MCW8863721.1 oxidoreductase [Colwellia sp.]MCW9081360.1 oxidoreductase [Colwellia sp.]